MQQVDNKTYFTKFNGKTSVQIKFFGGLKLKGFSWEMLPPTTGNAIRNTKMPDIYNFESLKKCPLFV